VVIIDTDTTVHTLYGQQMGGRKSYNPKNKGKKSYQRMSSEAGVFSGSQPHQSKSQSSVAWIAGRERN